jgi:protein-glutamine gamma-glutamyltransferase
VSANTQVAVLATLGREGGPTRGTVHAGERPLVRLAGFAALGLFGVTRWGTLMNPAPTWRLLGLLAVAVALAGIGPALLERERAVAAAAGRSEPISVVGAPLALLAFLAAFPIAGIPFQWIVHVRVSVTADAIGQGLSALPAIYVPYNGLNEWVQVAILLGAAVLLLDSAMLLAFAPAALGDVRRAGAALPLIAMVVVPATSVHPHGAYLEGIVLFALLAFFMWGERVPTDRRGSVLLACAAAGAVGMIFAPALDEHAPWINTQALARNFTPAHVERFDWSQKYGPLNWPRDGNNVLEVKASPAAFSGEYWKAENLDTFNGSAWVAGGPRSGNGETGVSAGTLRSYTQTLTVSVAAMSTTQVIAAGVASRPAHTSSPAEPGASAGTWTTTAALGDGDSYQVQVYAPHPAGARLAGTGEDYPIGVRRADLTLSLPQQTALGKVTAQTVRFPVFGSRHGAPRNETDPARLSGTAAIRNSPYARIYTTVARPLLRTAPTPYAYVQRVMSYLSSASGFTYNEYPPPTAYPLQTFLLYNRLGYCQQFAGAMALLLRMGGVPARVATGFTTGTYDSATKRWLVTDIDAHAWVEAWFPGYGWITFDPTPGAAPARGGKPPIGASSLLGGTSGLTKLLRHSESPGVTSTTGLHGHRHASLTPVWLGGLGALVALLALALVAWSRTAPLDAEGMLAELERALARSGRPISNGVTLAALERRFRTSPEAAGYVRALRMARFGGEPRLPTLGQRRALRAQLRAGLGLGGALRALWAVPPRPERRRRRARKHAASSARGPTAGALH